MDALRDGIPPDEGLETLTVGREKWISSIEEDLEQVRQGSSRLRVFNGRYGDGKTHLMKITRNKAFEHGFAVSYLSISQDIPLNRWDFIYQAIVKRLHTSSTINSAGLTSILCPDSPDAAIAENFLSRSESIRALSTLHPDFATAVYRFTTKQGTSIDVQQDLLLLRNWLEGQQMPARQIQGLGISSCVDRHNGHVMFDSMVQCLKYYGFAGMVLLIDEVESTLEQHLTVRKQAYENLRLIIDRERLPKHSFVVISTTPEMFSDEKKGFQAYPALWRRISEVRTSGPVNFRSTLVDLTRTPLSEEQLLSIGRKIRSLHSMARDWDPVRISDNYLEAAARIAVAGNLTLIFSPTAVFVKLVSDELDVAEQNTSYSPSGDDLRHRFQQIDRILHESRSTENWTA